MKYVVTVTSVRTYEFEDDGISKEEAAKLAKEEWDADGAWLEPDIYVDQSEGDVSEY